MRKNSEKFSGCFLLKILGGLLGLRELPHAMPLKVVCISKVYASFSLHFMI